MLVRREPGGIGMNSRPTQLIDMVGKTIEILGRTFTVDWIDAPRQPDNGKIMVQSDETEIYHIGDRYEAVADVMSEISSELRKEAKRKMNVGVHGKKVVE